MAALVKEEEVGSRAGIVKLMKKHNFSLIGGENAVVEMTGQELVKSDVYVVKYESNALVSTWLDSYIWVREIIGIVCDIHS